MPLPCGAALVSECSPTLPTLSRHRCCVQDLAKAPGEPLCPWTANRGVASHARADSIDAVAGRGGETHGRRRGASAGATTSGCVTSALGRRPRATRSFRRRTTRSRWQAPPTCWTAWRRWARITPCCADEGEAGGSESARMPGRRSTATLSCPPDRASRSSVTHQAVVPRDRHGAGVGRGDGRIVHQVEYYLPLGRLKGWALGRLRLKRRLKMGPGPLSCLGRRFLKRS